MKVLFISRSFPRDLRLNVTGTFQRMSMFVEAIGGVADLDMLFYVRPETDLSAGAVAEMERKLSAMWKVPLQLSLCPRAQHAMPPSKWQTYGAPAFSFYRQPGYYEAAGPQQVRAFEARLSGEPDVVFVHRLDAMCPVMLSRKAVPPVLFDLDDVEHVSLARSGKNSGTWKSRLIHYSRVPMLLRAELRAARLAQTTFVCSERDRRYLADRYGLQGVTVVPNAVRTAKPLPVAPEPTLMMLGAYWYQPNADAAEFLIERVWPHVHKVMPEAKLIIAGASPETISSYKRSTPNVEYAGFVDDLESLYARSRVVCAPILAGGGTRVKIVEAASYGRPVVSTRVGAEGLDFKDGHEILLRDDPEAFATACLELLRDSAEAERLGSAAHAVALQRYHRDNIVRLIRSHFETAEQSPEPLQAISGAAGR